MNTRSNQQGLSMLGWLVILFVVTFFITCAVKILPLYIDSWTLENSIENVVDKQALSTGSTEEIRSAIDRQFVTNRVDVMKARDLKIERKQGKIIIDATYERRTPLFYNIDVVVKFDHLIFELVPTGRD